MSVVTVAEAKTLGRITTSSHDTLLQDLIDMAESFVEEFCDIGLTSTEQTEKLDGGGYYLYPSRKPITAVSSITQDSDTISSDDYDFESFGIYQASEYPWASGKKEFTVVYTGGHSEVPAGLKLAIRQMVLRAYMNFNAKGSISEAGESVEWQSLWNGNDITALLEQYSYKSVLD